MSRRPVGIIRRQHLDNLVDDYVSWHEACGAVGAAYAAWKRAGRAEQSLAFSAYIAALDCEQEAAWLYQQAVERVAGMQARGAPAISLARRVDRP